MLIEFPDWINENGVIQCAIYSDVSYFTTSRRSWMGNVDTKDD